MQNHSETALYVNVARGWCIKEFREYEMSIQKLNHPLFHHVLKVLRAEKIKDKNLLIAVSGGVDSMSLLSIFLELKNILNIQLSAVHVHHGAQSKKQKQFQDQAFDRIKQYCEANKMLLHSKMLKTNVKLSEGDMRQKRYQFFLECIKKTAADYLVLAHTANDLLETRLIRLIRGTGRQGLLAMPLKRAKLLRPFIAVTRRQVVEYASVHRLSWCEDPSNSSSEYSFRNWIRNNWLVSLEKKQPGSVKALAKSIELVVTEGVKEQNRIKYLYRLVVINKVISRKGLQALSNKDKTAILACYMRKQHFTNYSLLQIGELVKQLDRPQKRFTFSLLGRIWKVTPLWVAPQKTLSKKGITTVVI